MGTLPTKLDVQREILECEARLKTLRRVLRALNDYESKPEVAGRNTLTEESDD